MHVLGMLKRSLYGVCLCFHAVISSVSCTSTCQGKFELIRVAPQENNIALYEKYAKLLRYSNAEIKIQH